jgi:hypothetical protein
MHRRRYLLPAGLMVLLALTLGAAFSQQAIFDWWRLRDYQPSQAVVDLADMTTLNDEGRRLFYVYHPSLENKSTFNQYCRENEHSIVLGCYLSGRGIYLLDITDQRLNGIKEVTAAHEMLHAAYERLNKNERKQVDEMTANAFKKLTNERIKNTVELYRTQKPDTLPNELHSILGTEARELPEELEQYYKQYFNDRLKVVAFSEQYENEFTNRKNKIKDYDAELTGLKQQIDALQQELNVLEENLKNDRARLNTLQSEGRTSEYNQGVPIYNQNVNEYNQSVEKLSGLIARYNEIVVERNAIASEERELVKAIDSRQTVPPTQ